MSRLHCARYTIPLHRPWWSRAWRATQRAWLQHRLQCVVDERQGYLANCERQITDFRQRLALLEIHS